MSIYLDASVLVALFTGSTLSEQVDDFLRSASELRLSNFARAEFASAIARLVRTRALSMPMAQGIFTDFDAWATQFTDPIEVVSSDFLAAETLLRRLDIPLKTPDTLHLAVVQRCGAELATLDDQLARTATKLDVPVSRLF